MAEATTKWLKYGKPVISATESWEKLNGFRVLLVTHPHMHEPGQAPNGEKGTRHIWYQAVSKPDSEE